MMLGHATPTPCTQIGWSPRRCSRPRGYRGQCLVLILLFSAAYARVTAVANTLPAHAKPFRVGLSEAANMGEELVIQEVATE